MATRARPRLLDLFSGAGGASMGYHRAGFEVVGVDIEPQPHYPFEFHQGDATAVQWDRLGGCFWLGDLCLGCFDAVAASPPCPRFSVLSKSWNGAPELHPDYVDLIRRKFDATGLPYVIENVVGAPLRDPLRLCGSMFGLAVERHRLFESNIALTGPACDHAAQALTWPDGFPALRSGRETRARVVGVFGTGGGSAKDFETWRWAMGIGWMRTKAEIADSIPPAYTLHIGRQLHAHDRQDGAAR